MKNKHILLILIFIGQSNLYAQKPSEILYTYLEAASNDSAMNGSLLFSANGGVVVKKSFGYADFEKKITNSDSTLFPLASISKTFTSVAILQLKEKKKLKLDDTFAKYFVDFPFPNITIRQLLSHTSGLPDTETMLDSLIRNHKDKIFSNKDVLPALIIYASHHSLLFTPGEKWSYSTFGFDLLALLVEKVSHQSFPKYVQKHIFQPAGMTHSYIQTNLAQTKEANRTSNYQFNNHFEMKLQRMDTLQDWKEWTYNLTGLYGGNNVVSSTVDLYKYDEALYNGTFLTQNSLNEAFSPVKLNNGEDNQAVPGTSSGLGWFIFTDTTNGKIVWHSGSNPGVQTLLVRNITKKETYIVLQNIPSPLNVYLATLDIIKGKTVIYKKSLGFLYGQDLFTKGANYAYAHLKTLQNDSVHYVLLESEIDRIGLEFSRTKFQDNSLEAYKLNTMLFPDSWSAYNSYATILAKNPKNKDAAIWMFNKSIFLNPQNEEGKKRLENLLK